MIDRPALHSHFTYTICIYLIAISSLLTKAEAYIITIDAGGAEECFHERVVVGTKLGFIFEVMEGGFYDIDVEIKDPYNVVLHRDEKASEGKFTIEANQEGPHHFCFSNKKSSQTPKVIIFDIDKTEPYTSGSQNRPSKDGETSNSETQVLENMLNNLVRAALAARHDVRYLSVRDRVHRKISEATNSTVIWWAGLEFILLLTVTLGQVWYLKRFFEIRRTA